MLTQNPLLEKSNFANEIFPYLMGSFSLLRHCFRSSTELQYNAIATISKELMAELALQQQSLCSTHPPHQVTGMHSVKMTSGAA